MVRRSATPRCFIVRTFPRVNCTELEILRRAPKIGRSLFRFVRSRFKFVAINLYLQFCANNPDYLLKAALYVQDYADAVDSKFSILNSNQLNSLQSTSVVHRVLQSGDTMDPSCWRTGL